VSIPQRCSTSSTSTTTQGSHRYFPFVLTCIYTWYFSMSFHLWDKLVQEVAIWRPRVASPRTAWWWILFNIDPNHTKVYSIRCWWTIFNSICLSPFCKVNMILRWLVSHYRWSCHFKWIIIFIWSCWHTLGIDKGSISNCWWCFFCECSITQVLHHGGDLGRCWLSSAGEHVDINIGETCCSSIVYICDNICIITTVGAPSSGDSKAHTRGFHAWESTGAW